MVLNDLEELPNKTNWASLVRNLLMSLGSMKCGFSRGSEILTFFCHR